MASQWLSIKPLPRKVLARCCEARCWFDRKHKSDNLAYQSEAEMTFAHRAEVTSYCERVFEELPRTVEEAARLRHAVLRLGTL